MCRALAYLPAALWAALLIHVGATSELPQTPAVPHLDKALHFGAWAVLGWLLGTGWDAGGRRPRWGWLLGLALLLGAVDEYQQSRNTERSAELADWLADALGASAGVYLAVRLTASQRRQWDNE